MGNHHLTGMLPNAGMHVSGQSNDTHQRDNAGHVTRSVMNEDDDGVPQRSR